MDKICCVVFVHSLYELRHFHQRKVEPIFLKCEEVLFIVEDLSGYVEYDILSELC